MADREMAGGWLMERRVSAALIMTIMLQTAAALLWTGAAGERLEALERKAATSERLLERTARLEEQNRHIRGSLLRIERRLEALTEN